MDIEEIKKKINNVGNIKVIFEPSIYNENRIQKKNLQEILEKSRVSLRGWDFPHMPLSDKDSAKRPYSIGNGIEFYTIWEEINEMFRFYQSGQFLAKFTLSEDALGERYNRKIEPGKYLDFLSLIYRITEVTLFVKNLVENTDIEGGKITIEINKTQNRELESIFSPNIFSFNAGYVCRMDKVVSTVTFSKEKISADFLDIAGDLIKSIFDDFNWKNYLDSTIRTHQENILNRRL